MNPPYARARLKLKMCVVNARRSVASGFLLGLAGSACPLV